MISWYWKFFKGNWRKTAIVSGFATLLLILASRALAAPQLSPFDYPQSTDSMRQYFLLKYLIMIAGPLLYSAIFVLLLHSGLLLRLKNRLSNKPYIYVLSCFAALLYASATLLNFPLHFISSFVLEHHFALSDQSFASWMRDDLTHIFIGASLSIPALVLCFSIVRKFHKRWFIPLWLLLSASIAALTFLEPLLFAPAFNSFSPLPASSLRSGIERLCHESGIMHPTILVADKSKQTKKLNAYVSGLFSSKRVVLYDSLVKDVPEDEILQVVAHELGHYRLKHVAMGVVLSMIVLLPLLWLAEFAINRILPRLPLRWGISTSYDPCMMALVFVALWILPFLLEPFPNAVSRYVEAEADAYALRLTQNPLAAAKIFRTLAQRNLSDPDPPALIELWFFSHPSLKHRIDAALKHQ